MKLTQLPLGLLFGTALACASAPRPVSLDQSQATAANPNMNAARELAPQAFAHAEQIRIRAERAHDGERLEEADALAQQSLVAYERAAAAARRLDLERQLAEANEQSAARGGDVARVAALQAQVAAETQALERSVELERTAEPLHPIRPEGGARAEARSEAARSIAEAARLSCVAARLVASANEQATNERAATALTVAETLLAELPKLAPHTALEKAMNTRLECLAALTAARAKTTPSPDQTDALLSKLSASMSDLRPHQDDRGIVLTDFGTWEGTQLSAHGADVVARIANVVSSSAHPVLVVLHQLRSPGAQSSAALTREAVTAALSQHRLQATVAVVSSPLPSLLDLPPTKDRALRTEFILVTAN